MKNQIRLTLAAIFWLMAGPATAGLYDDNELSRMDPAYAEECGGCHVPYPAAFLPAGSWKAMLVRLERHFDVDATPDDANRAAISRYLDAKAGPSSTKAAPERISKSPWFLKKHARVRGGGWPVVKTLSHCDACHLQAEQGRYATLVSRKPR